MSLHSEFEKEELVDIVNYLNTVREKSIQLNDITNFKIFNGTLDEVLVVKIYYHQVYSNYLVHIDDYFQFIKFYKRTRKINKIKERICTQSLI